MTVLTPVDTAEVRLAVRAAAAIPGPVYIRVNRNPVLDLLDKDAPSNWASIGSCGKAAMCCSWPKA